MKIKYIIFLIFNFSFIAFTQVQLKFISINQNGNNLYLDNLLLSKQYNNDVAVVSLNNINPDTTYLSTQSSFSVAPGGTVINLGKNVVSVPFTVTLTVSPGGYSSTKTISSALVSGQTLDILFDNITIIPGQPFSFTLTVNYAGDENPANNSLTQSSLYFPGTTRMPLLEEWTNSGCGPCAAQNPTIDAYINSKFDSLVAIKFHVFWPSATDPFYLYNVSQQVDSRQYYNINAVPDIIMDGIFSPSFPYSDPNSLPDALYSRNQIGTPIIIAVTNTRIPGDTIEADVSVQVISPLKPGNYNLKVYAVERAIHYVTAPGGNGEKDFYDVFRAAYPNSVGTPVSVDRGNYNFKFKYYIDMSVWQDSMIYTFAFVQNDATKEVLNSAKSRNYTDASYVNNFNTIISGEKKVPAPLFISRKFNNSPHKIENNNPIASLYELFERNFPPAGWTVINPDGGPSFQQYSGANGPMFYGNKCVTVPFYSYSGSNQADTLYSPMYYNLSASDSIKFNYAYAQYQNSQDRLIIKLSNDGGITFPLTIFDKMGSALATAPVTNASFIPTSNQWGSFSYPLAGLVTPVELSSFDGTFDGVKINLYWTTSSEINNKMFEVQKELPQGFVTIGSIIGNGTTTFEHKYCFSDINLLSGINSYRLKQNDFNGSVRYSEIINVESLTPNSFSLSQNYPNPFNPSTMIRFTIPFNGFVKLIIYNALGQKVTSLINQFLEAGSHVVTFNASDLPGGVYFYKLESGIFSSVKKCILIK